MKKLGKWELGTAAAINVLLRHVRLERRFPPRWNRNLPQAFYLAELANDHVRNVLDGRTAPIDDQGNPIRRNALRRDLIERATKMTWNGSSTNGAAERFGRARASLSGQSGELLPEESKRFLENLLVVVQEYCDSGGKIVG